jgi:hypothetical protein
MATAEAMTTFRWVEDAMVFDDEPVFLLLQLDNDWSVTSRHGSEKSMDII